MVPVCRRGGPAGPRGLPPAARMAALAPVTGPTTALAAVRFTLSDAP